MKPTRVIQLGDPALLRMTKTEAAEALGADPGHLPPTAKRRRPERDPNDRSGSSDTNTARRKNVTKIKSIKQRSKRKSPKLELPPPVTSGQFVFHEEVEIETLVDHPNYPRLAMDEKHIHSLMESMSTSGYRREDAPRVRILSDDGVIKEVIAGRYRVEAARRLGFKVLPCWVAQNMRDDEANCLLVALNHHRELTRLEIGLHVLRTVPQAKGGRGIEGGRSDFARRIGVAPQTMSGWVAAAEVYQAVTKGDDQATTFRTKARHLTAIAKALPSEWDRLVRALIAEGWSVKRTKREVEALALPAEKRSAELSGAKAEGEVSAAPTNGAEVGPSAEPAPLPVPANGSAAKNGGDLVPTERAAPHRVVATREHSTVRDSVARVLDEATDLTHEEAFALAQAVIPRLDERGCFAVIATAVGLLPVEKRMALGIGESVVRAAQ